MEGGVLDLRSQVANGLLLGSALQLAEKASIDSDEVYKAYWEVYSLNTAKRFSNNSLSEKGRVMWNDEHDCSQATRDIDFLRDILHDHLWVVRAALVYFSFDLSELEDVLLEGIRRTDDVSSIAEQLLIEASCTQSFDLSRDGSQLSAFLESSLTTHDVEYLSYRYALQLKLRVVKQLQHIIAHFSERHSEYLLRVMESLERGREQSSQQQQQGGNKYVDLLDVELSHSLDRLPEGGAYYRSDADSLYEAAARVAALDAPPFDAAQHFFGLLTDIRQHRALSGVRLGLSSEQPQAVVMDPFDPSDSLDIAGEFHSLRPLDLARYCARSGLVDCLGSILQQVSTRIPALELLDILGAIPASIPPLQYSHLLPRHGLSSSASASSQLSNIDIVDSPAVLQTIQRCSKAVSVVTESKRSDANLSRILTHLIRTPTLDNSSSESFEAGLLNAATARWAVRRCMYLDSVGFTMHAFQCASCVVAHLVDDDSVSARGLQGWNAATDGGFTEEKDNVVSLLGELANQLYHFSAMLYGQLIPHDSAFIDWLCAGRMGQYDLVVAGRSEIDADNKPFSEVLVSFFRPMFDGDRRLFQTLSWKDLLVGLLSEGAFELSISRSYQEKYCLCAATSAAEMVSDTMQVGWCDWLVDAVSLSVVPGDISSLHRAVDVANASNPTLPLDSRLLLLWSDLSLVQLVVRACLAYDDIQSGRDLMWHLVECTPVRAKVSITTDGSSYVGLDSWYRKLDAIELALTASEVLKSYVHSPPLSSLTKSDDLTDTRTMKYKERLLQSCELLMGRLELLYGLGTCAASSLTLSQALILKICSAFIRKDRSDPRVWEQLLTDVLELDSVEFFRSTTSMEGRSIMSWIGVLILHCFVHSCSESMDCKYYVVAIQDVLNSDPQHEIPEPLSSTLIGEFHVSSDLCQRVILNECRCAFNSMDGILSGRSEFERCSYLLSLIPSSSSSSGVMMMMDADSEVHSEKCVLKVAGLVHHVGLDIQPLDIRSRLSESPEKFISTLLTEQPFAYYTLLDEQYDLSIDIISQSSPDSQSCGAPSSNSTDSNSASRCDRLSSAVDLAMLLIDASNRRYSEIERSAQMVKIFVHLTRTAMTVGDLGGAASYCGLVLREQSYSTLDIAQQQAVVDLVSVVMRSLQETKAAELSLDRLDSELRMLMMKNSNAEVLMGLLSPSPTAVLTVDACDSFQQGKSLLYRIVALMLHGEDSGPTDLSAISGDSSINDLLHLSAIPLLKQELVCAFIVQKDYSAIAALLDSIVRDLRKKLSQVASQVTISGSDSDCSLRLRLDEGMVDKLVGKGFSRNGAKRSIISTRGVSLEAALSWAIEHSLDRDFENPIAQSVKGALLSNDESGSELSSATIAQNMKQIIRFIEDLDNEFRLMMHGVAESLPSESRVKSKNNIAGHRRKQSMGARRLSDSESISFDDVDDVTEQHEIESSSSPPEQHEIESSSSSPPEQHVIESSSSPPEQHKIESSSSPTEQHEIESSSSTRPEQHEFESSIRTSELHEIDCSSRPPEQQDLLVSSSSATEQHEIQSSSSPPEQHEIDSSSSPPLVDEGTLTVTETRSSIINFEMQVPGESTGTTDASTEKLEETAIHVNPLRAENAEEIIRITNDGGNINTEEDTILGRVDNVEEILCDDAADEFINIDAVNEDRDTEVTGATTDQCPEAYLLSSNNAVSVATDHATNIGVTGGWSDFDIEFDDDDVAQEVCSGGPSSSVATIESHLRNMFEVAEEEIWFNLNRAATYISCFDSFAHGTNQLDDAVDDSAQDSRESFAVVMQQVLALCCLLSESTVDPQQGLSAVIELLESVTDADFHVWFARQMEERVFTSMVLDDCSSSGSLLLQKCIHPSKQFSCWLMAATNFKATYAQQKQKVSKIENQEDIFSRDPLRCLLLIAQLYVQADSSDYQGIRNLKRLFSEVLTADRFTRFLDQDDDNREEFVSLLRSSSIFNSNPGDYHQAVTRHTLTVDLLQKLDEQLQEDLSMLRRIAKIVGDRSGLGLDLKAILKSVTIVSSCRELFAVSRIEDTCLKQGGLLSIIRYLTLVDVAQWNRAIGRTLDVGPSELHLYLAIHHLHNYVGFDLDPNGSRNHEQMSKFLSLSNTLADIVTKMRKEHIDILLLVIAGISSSLIESLKKAPAILLASHTNLSVGQKVKDLFAINVDYAVRGEIFLFLQQFEKPKSAEMAHCAALAPFFVLFCRCIPSLPSDILNRILRCSFGDSDAMHCCLRDALLRESVPKSSTTDLVSFALIAHPTICNLMFRVNLSIPDEGDAMISGYFISQVADTINSTKSRASVSLTTRGGGGEVGSLFRGHISAMRSITSKGLCALLELGDTSGWSRQQYLWQLLNLFVKLEVAPIDHLRSEGRSNMMSSTWGDVCWLDEGAISDYLSAAPQGLHTSCMHVYVGIATLFHLSSLMVDLDGDELALAIKCVTAVLLTRIYLAELVFLDVLSTSDFDRIIHVEVLTFGDSCLQSSNAASPMMYNPSDIINLVRAVTDAVESSHIVDEAILQRSILLLMQLQRVWTLLNDPLQNLLEGSWKQLPSNLQLLQCSLKARSLNELLVCSADCILRPFVVIPLELMVAVLKLLLRSHMYPAFIELLVVDFALLLYSVKFEKHRVLSADEEGPSNADSYSCWDEWQQNLEVVKAVDLLPDRSSYKRQAQLCLGLEAAQNSCLELEEILKTRGVPTKVSLRLQNNDALGDDALSLVLILILLRSTNYQSLLNPTWKAETLNRVLSSRYILPLLTAISSKCSGKGRCELDFNPVRPISLTGVLDSLLSSTGTRCGREHVAFRTPLSLTTIALSAVLVLHGHFSTASYIAWTCCNHRPAALFVHRLGLQHLIQRHKDSRLLFLHNSIHYQQVLDILQELLSPGHS